MDTLSYILGNERKIERGTELYFGQIWDGDGNGDELLESGAVSPDNENVIAFDVLLRCSNILDSRIRVTSIY